MSCGTAAIVVGEEPPAMSVAFADGLFSVFFADFDLDDPDALPSELVCAGCLVEHYGDGQLGRGLDLAREHGEAEYDPGAGKWFVPARHEAS